MTATVDNEITIDEASSRLGRSKQQIRKWIGKGIKRRGSQDRIKLAARKIGRTWLISPADLDEFSRRLTEAALSK